jgi:hypothetical protein
MITFTSYKIDFEFEGKTHKCTIDSMYIEGHKPEVFFRIAAKSGNRDLICHNRQWMVISGPPLRDTLVDALGKAIELAVEKAL